MASWPATFGGLNCQRCAAATANRRGRGQHQSGPHRICHRRHRSTARRRADKRQRASRRRGRDCRIEQGDRHRNRQRRCGISESATNRFSASDEADVRHADRKSPLKPVGAIHLEACRSNLHDFSQNAAGLRQAAPLSARSSSIIPRYGSPDAFLCRALTHVCIE